MISNRAKRVNIDIIDGIYLAEHSINIDEVKVKSVTEYLSI
jgi:hypothetical protein